MNTESQLHILENKISELAKHYRVDCKEGLWESKNTEEYGFNEYIGGKADGYEDCLSLIKKCMQKSRTES